MKLLIALIFCSIVSAQRVAFVQNSQLWVRQVPDGRTRVIVSSGNPHAPRFSADGAWIAFLDGDQLGLIAWAGGEIHRPLGAQPVSRVRWSSVGGMLAIVTSNSVYLSSESTAWKPSRIFAGDPQSAVFSPDGKWVAISSLESDREAIPQHGKIEILPVDASMPTRTIQTAGQWEQLLPLAWSGDTIVAWKGEISGSAETDGFEVWGYSTSGARSYKLGGPALVHEELHALSPGGKKLALTDGNGRQAWTHKKITVIDLETGKSSTLTSTDVAALYPVWSPNGEAIAFVGGPDAADVWGGDQARAALNRRHLWIMDSDGSHKRQLTSDAAFRDERPVWLDGGKALIFYRLDHNDQASVWSVDLSGSEPQLLAGPFVLDQDHWFGVYGYFDWNDRIAIYPALR
jgi:Tol biopolymer transport system component